jgi:hypothetical protein
MILAAEVMVCGAVDALESPYVIKKAKEELAGRAYICAIPDEVNPKPISKL